TNTLSNLLEIGGLIKKDFDDIADIYVINTCSVTENADKECKQIVRKIQLKSPESFIVITGCYAQLKPAEIANINGVDLVLGAAEKFNLLHHLKDLQKGDPTKIACSDIDEIQDFHASFSIQDRTRTFLKVQDGCDYNCSFCTIPLARGSSRSNTIQNVLNQVHQIAEKGVQEIVLTGINLGDFGKQPNIVSAQKQENFFDLLKKLDEIENIPRFRISSIEPNLLTNEIIEFVANSKRIMPHFHIPLQSGSNEILKQMQRRYKKELYTERVNLIKEKMPHCCIGVDVIVGFPGETDEYFNETFAYLHQLDISYLHVFTYSERENTKALQINPIVPIQQRKERSKILRNLSYQKMQYFQQQFKGTTRKVLFEKMDKNLILQGYTDNYIRVSTFNNYTLENKIIDFTI
ncbi:MAG: tRNA (N(6)-L-threonylcarbamoyladenosine(37)-C(2))-methylthiotransferase MtaB, partial [Sediminibacterium sp.]|nr:tRNA (N(6)-L-threonylcarbamoyladenosine(37)-C(2))-methylthiotransferase MtaB [Sediminibacterium sp.]